MTAQRIEIVRVDGRYQTTENPVLVPGPGTTVKRK